jgi:hypothetical protein
MHDLGLLHCFPSSGHIFLLGPEALIFLMKVCQLLCGDNFDILLKILVLIIFSFNF